MKWMKRRERDRRGLDLQHLVPEMLQYVAERYEPLIQYSIGGEVSLTDISVQETGEKPVKPAEPEQAPAPASEAESAEKGTSSGKASSSIQTPPLSTQPSPKVSYSIRDPEIRYSLPRRDDADAAIRDMGKFAKEAEKDMALYDSPALENTYHAWERKNAEYKSFSSEVVRMVKEKYQKTSEFYHAAGIDKRTWHKISTDFGYKPSRMTAFRCCIGLKLNAEEAEELLKLAGMAFSPNDPDDLVLKFCLENGIRDIPGINYMLYRYATREQEK